MCKILHKIFSSAHNVLHYNLFTHNIISRAENIFQIYCIDDDFPVFLREILMNAI